MAFSDLWIKLKEITRRMFGMEKTIEQTLHMAPAVSSKMTEAIDRWTAMYEDNASWLNEPNPKDCRKVVSLGLPAFIASEKARMAVIELQSDITAPKKTEEKDNPEYFVPYIDAQTGELKSSGVNKTIITEVATSPTERAEFMDKEYKRKLLSKIRTQLEFGIAKGSFIIKPYVVKCKVKGVAGTSEETTEKEKDKYEFAFDFVQADCFYPFAFDSSGNLVEVAFVQTKTDKDKVYTRLEYHKLTGNVVEIRNTAYMNENANVTVANGLSISLGKQIPLTSVYEWKDIPETAVIQNVDRLLFGYFKMPDANTIDPHSPLGISGFARAEKLIKEADLQYSRLLWEYEGGEMAIDIDRDALKYTKDDEGNGRSMMQNLQNRLYRTVDLGESDTYRVFAPSLRDASLLNGLNAILMRIEDVVAMSRGTLSDATAEARTATEIRILKQRSYSSNLEIQKALQIALEDTIYAMDVYCTMYNIVGDIKKKGEKIDVSQVGKYEVSFTWDDSILVDVETELNKRMTLLNAGISSKKEVRMWYFGETEGQAQDALDEIAKENQQAVEQNAVASSQMGQMIQESKQDTTQAKQEKQTKTQKEKTNQQQESENDEAEQQAE